MVFQGLTYFYFPKGFFSALILDFLKACTFHLHPCLINHQRIFPISTKGWKAHTGGYGTRHPLLFFEHTRSL